MHCAGDDVPLEAGLYIPQDCATVRAFPQPEDSEKHSLFEGPEDIRHLCLHCSHTFAECKMVAGAKYEAATGFT